MTFTSGTKVRCTHDAGRERILTKGAVYTVESVDELATGTFVHLKGIPAGLRSTRFEKVEEPERLFGAGDWVRLQPNVDYTSLDEDRPYKVTRTIRHNGNLLFVLEGEQGWWWSTLFERVEAPEFEPGDRLLCVDDSEGPRPLKQGNVYTYRESSSEVEGLIYVDGVDDPVLHWRFEKVDEPDYEQAGTTPGRMSTSPPDEQSITKIQDEINRQEFQRSNERLQAHMRAKREAETTEALRKAYAQGVTSGELLRAEEEPAKRKFEERVEKYQSVVGDFMDEAVQEVAATPEETAENISKVADSLRNPENDRRIREVLERFEEEPPVRVMVHDHGAYGDLSDLLVLLEKAGDLDVAFDWVEHLQRQGLADMHVRNEDQSREKEAPDPVDLVHELHEAVHGYSWARAQSPKEVWEELLDEVDYLREQSEGRLKEQMELTKRKEVEAKEYAEALKQQYESLKEALDYPEDTEAYYYEELVDEVNELRKAYNGLREEQHSKRSGMISDSGIRALVSAAERYTSDRETVLKVIANAFDMEREEIRDVLA